MPTSGYRCAGAVFFLAFLVARPALAQQDKIIASLQKAGGVVIMDPTDPKVAISFTMGANATDKELEACAELKTIRKVSLPADGNRVTDKGISALGKLTDLEELHIGHTQLTDAGLARLKGLKNLK